MIVGWLTAAVVSGFGQAGTPLPPCANGMSECMPWERDWPHQSAPATPQRNPFADLIPKTPAERLGAGPHTLIVSDGSGMTRVGYPSGSRCLAARNSLRQQAAPPPNTRGIIYGSPRIQAVCVPR